MWSGRRIVRRWRAIHHNDREHASQNNSADAATDPDHRSLRKSLFFLFFLLSALRILRLGTNGQRSLVFFNFIEFFDDLLRRQLGRRLFRDWWGGRWRRWWLLGRQFDHSLTTRAGERGFRKRIGQLQLLLARRAGDDTHEKLPIQRKPRGDVSARIPDSVPKQMSLRKC